MILVCNLNQILLNENQKLIVNEFILDYKQYTVYIYSKDNISIKRVDYEVPFLYSETQIIDINERINSYNLKFNIESSSNVILILKGSSYSNQILLDNCQTNNEILNCEISRNKLETILSKNNEQFNISAINDNIGLVEFKYVQPITINYNDIKKEDVIVNITEIVRNLNENPLIFNTSVSLIREFHSYLFSFIGDNNNEFCFLKKTKFNPLLLFCFYPNGFSSNNFTLENELVLNDIHYKYNFRIQPFHFNTSFSLSNFISSIFLTYPEELDFRSQNSATVKFIANNPPKAGYVSISYKTKYKVIMAGYFDCQDLNSLKICNVPFSYFSLQEHKEVDYCYVSHAYSYNNRRYEYLAPMIKVTLPPKIINIYTNINSNRDTRLIDRNGVFYLGTSHNDTRYNIFDSSDIEQKTMFKINMAAYSNSIFNQIIVGVNCRLWEPKNKNLILICKTNEDLNTKLSSPFKAYFYEAYFYYNDYRVVITSSVSSERFSFKNANTYCPFLYADELNINLIEFDNSYELRFKVESYNNEPLLLYNGDKNYISLDNCKKNSKVLICKIDKEKLFEQYNNQVFKVYYMNELLGLQEFSLLPEVTINSYLIEKETIYVLILNLEYSSYDLNNHVAFRTNVSKIEDVNTANFLLDSDRNINCFLKKVGTEPLFALCRWPEVGTFTLGQIKSQIILDNINIRYNFIISPVSNSENFKIESQGSLPLFVFPQVVDFYLSDSIYIYIGMQYPENTTSISLNSASNYLECQDDFSSSKPFKKCIINKETLSFETGQYYYLYHKNNEGKNVRFYELSPIYIRIPKNTDIVLRVKKEDNKDLIQIGNNGVICFITDYYEAEDTVLYNIDLDTITSFESKITDENQNEYNVNCKLWNPISDKVRILCKLNQNLKYETQNIILNNFSFELQGYTIYIYGDTYVEVKQINDDFSFLYAPQQNINITSNTTTFDLIFKCESYNNNDLLYLYGARDNYLFLDNCVKNDKELNCTVLREKMDEIITKNLDTYSVGIINDNIGAYKINNIFNITIYREFNQKIYITLNLMNPFGLRTEIGIPFGFETDINDIENLITEKFENCYFKKIRGRPLLYACVSEKEQTYKFWRSSSSKYIKDKHWKYNFVIRPYNKAESFLIRGTASIFKAVFPEILDFSNKDALIIRYLTNSPTLTKNIKLILSSSNLECHDLNEMKKCIVSYTHLRNNSPGNFFTYYKNYLDEFNVYYSLPPFDITLPQVNALELIIEDYNNQNTLYLGKEPVLYLLSNFSDALNIFDNSEFNIDITFSNNMNNKVVKGNCNLWKTNDQNIRFICKLKDNFENGEQIIYLNEYSFNYKEYKLLFYSNAKNIHTKQLKSKIAFLFSDNQEININDYTDTYTMKFKKEFYDNETLILYNNKLKKINFACNDEDTEVNCNITKDEIIQILSYNGEKFHIAQITNSEGILPIYSILGITLNYPNVQKIEIDIEITKLLSSIVEINNFIAYETNITNISMISTDYFNIAPNRNDITNCLFKKNNIKDNLLLLCLASNTGETTLGQIDEITLSNISILYDFKIAETNKNETINIIDEESSLIFSVYPTEIDFNKNESFIIRYEIEYPEKLNGIRLNNDSLSELKCSNKIGIKECIVTNDHFNSNGDYYTYHENSLGYKLISYEISTIKVIIKEKEDEKHEGGEEEKPDSNLAGVIVGSIIGGLAFIALVIFIIWMYKKKCAKNSNIDIEEKTAPLTGQEQIELREEPKQLD